MKIFFFFSNYSYLTLNLFILRYVRWYQLSLSVISHIYLRMYIFCTLFRYASPTPCWERFLKRQKTSSKLNKKCVSLAFCFISHCASVIFWAFPKRLFIDFLVVVVRIFFVLDCNNGMFCFCFYIFLFNLRYLIHPKEFAFICR